METTKQEAQAYDRGFARGCSDCGQGFHNEAPLSGEWAGESIPELIGDLFDEDFANFDALCEAYEQGYNEAFTEQGPRQRVS